MFTSIPIDAREVEARRQALRWLSSQLHWEQALGRLRRRDRSGSGDVSPRDEPTRKAA